MLVPIKGAEQIKRGAVSENEMHFGNISGIGSRRYNPVEASPELKKIYQNVEHEINKVNEKGAKKVLEFYRSLLKPYKTHNHEIKISAAKDVSHVKLRSDLAADGYEVPAFARVVAPDDGEDEVYLSELDLMGAIEIEGCDDDTKPEYNFVYIQLTDGRKLYMRSIDLDWVM